MKNYYDELEVSHSASKEVIEKVYKVLAKKYHPDTTKEIDKIAAEEKFKIISEAYEVLSNDEKRKKYDIELEQSNPNISYEDYMNMVNQRDSLNNSLNNLKNEFNDFKTSVNSNNHQNIQPNNQRYANQYNNQQYNNQQYNNPHINQNLNNYIQTYNNNVINNSSRKRRYYNVVTGQPVSAFAYYKYKIKKFFSNLLFIILSIILGILIFNKFSNLDLFDILNLSLK